MNDFIGYFAWADTIEEQKKTSPKIYQISNSLLFLVSYHNIEPDKVIEISYCYIKSNYHWMELSTKIFKELKEKYTYHYVMIKPQTLDLELTSNTIHHED